MIPHINPIGSKEPFIIVALMSAWEEGGIQKWQLKSKRGPRGPHTVADRRILFKKSLMVLKDPYGSPEVPYTPESQNLLLKKFQIIRYV